MLRRIIKTFVNVSLYTLNIGGIFIFKILESKPKISEILSNNVIKLAVETIFSSQLTWLTKNGNPTTTSVVRDVLMVPGVEINIYNKQEIAGGFSYDVFSRVGTITRGGCKIIAIQAADQIIYTANSAIDLVNYYDFFNDTLHSINQDKYASAARIANIVCEPISLLLNVIIPQDRQIEGMTDMAWYVYIYRGAKEAWLYKALIGTVGRAYVPDQMGELLRWVKSFDIIKSPYYLGEELKNQALSSIFAIEKLNSNDDIWTQISKVNQQIDGINAYIADAIILVCGYSYRMLIEVAQGYIMITPTRAAFRWIEAELRVAPPLQAIIKVIVIVAAYNIVYNMGSVVFSAEKDTIDSSSLDTDNDVKLNEDFLSGKIIAHDDEF